MSHLATSNSRAKKLMIWDLTHVKISHASHMNESWRTHELVMSHIWRSSVTHMNWLCRTRKWVISRTWMSRVIHMNESPGKKHPASPRIENGVEQPFSRQRKPWPANKCAYDWFILVTRLFSCVRHDMTNSYVWLDSFICVTWLVYMCNTTLSNIWNNSFIRVTWLIHTEVKTLQQKQCPARTCVWQQWVTSAMLLCRLQGSEDP